MIAVGGSGGHLLPAQQLADLLKNSREVAFAGSQLSQNSFFQKQNFFFQDIDSAPLSSPFRFIYRSIKGIFQSIRLLKKFRPDVVVGFGSYHSFPVLAAAFFLRKKIVLFEANCILGKVNRLFAPSAHTLALQFPLENTPFLKNHRYVSYLPWQQKPCSFTKEEALHFYGLDDSLPVCLVFGGSQGAAFFNEKAPSLLSGFQVIHCTGKKENVPSVQALYEKHQIRAFVQAFEPDMTRAYRAAHFALCRSGAGTLAELIRYQLPAVLIPFPHATDCHQTANARFFCSEVKGGIWLAQTEVSQMRRAIEKCLLNLSSFQDSIRLFYEKSSKRVELADLIQEL